MPGGKGFESFAAGISQVGSEDAAFVKGSACVEVRKESQYSESENDVINPCRIEATASAVLAFMDFALRA